MKTKFLFPVLILISILTACNTDDTTSNLEADYLRITLYALPGDQSSRIVCYPEMPETETHIDFSDLELPDFYEIYSSGQIDGNYTKVYEIYDQDWPAEYTFTNLENGCPYYYYTITYQEGKPARYSDTIMVIPSSKGSNPVTIWESEDFLLQTTVSPDNKNLVYIRKSRPGALVLVENNGGTLQGNTIIKNCNSANWSHNGEYLIASVQEDDHTSQIIFYNVAEEESVYLTEGKGHKANPTFSKDDGRIVYQYYSIQNEKSYSSITLYDPENNSSQTLTDLPATNLTIAANPVWFNNETILFHARINNYKTGLYTLSIDNKNINPVLKENRWNDIVSAISPDNTRVAFISDRSGTYQIWLYNFETGELEMLTRFEGSWYDNSLYMGEANKITWINDSVLTFTTNWNTVTRLTIN